jgi:hypothetical protein
VVATDTIGTTVTFSATSAGGTSKNSVTVKIDKTPPAIIGSISPAPAATGWYNIVTGAPTVSFVGSDSGSSLASVSDPSSLGEGSIQSVTGTAKGNAGIPHTPRLAVLMSTSPHLVLY